MFKLCYRSVYPICLPPRGETFANRRAFVIGKVFWAETNFIMVNVDSMISSQYS